MFGKNFNVFSNYCRLSGSLTFGRKLQYFYVDEELPFENILHVRYCALHNQSRPRLPPSPPRPPIPRKEFKTPYFDSPYFVYQHEWDYRSGLSEVKHAMTNKEEFRVVPLSLNIRY